MVNNTTAIFVQDRKQAGVDTYVRIVQLLVLIEHDSLGSVEIFVPDEIDESLRRGKWCGNFLECCHSIGLDVWKGWKVGREMWSQVLVLDENNKPQKSLFSRTLAQRFSQAYAIA